MNVLANRKFWEGVDLDRKAPLITLEVIAHQLSDDIVGRLKRGFAQVWTGAFIPAVNPDWIAEFENGIEEVRNQKLTGYWVEVIDTQNLQLLVPNDESDNEFVTFFFGNIYDRSVQRVSFVSNLSNYDGIRIADTGCEISFRDCVHTSCSPHHECKKMRYIDDAQDSGRYFKCACNG